jgi:dinuclear metal center YbgI/SA1388 family protein
MSIWKLELMEALHEIADEESQEPWDNGGIQVDVGTLEINRILVALEVTTEVIQEANELAVDYIVVHHPLIFQPLSEIDANEVVGHLVVELIQSGIGVYASHTAFDKVKGGNNDFMAELLDLVNTRPLLSIDNEYLGVRGQLKEPLTLDTLCGNLGRALAMDIHDFRIVGSLEKPIRSPGIIVGSGGSYVRDAIYNGCDVLITGDVKYHDAQLAKEAGISVIDAGHYGTEKSFVANMTEKLKEKILVKAEIIPSNVMINPFTKL